MSKLLPMNIPNRVIRDNIMMINLEQMEFTYGRKNENVDTIEWKEKKGIINFISCYNSNHILNTVFPKFIQIVISNIDIVSFMIYFDGILNREISQFSRDIKYRTVSRIIAAS